MIAEQPMPERQKQMPERQKKEYTMRKIIIALSAILFGLGWTALPVLAQSQGQYAPSGTSTQRQPGSTQQQPGSTQQQPGASQQQSQPGSVNQSQAPNAIASRFAAQASGEVTNVDHQTGKLTLKTVDGEVNATFPPAAVQHVRQGDHVTLAIGLIDTSSPSASPRTTR